MSKFLIMIAHKAPLSCVEETFMLLGQDIFSIQKVPCIIFLFHIQWHITTQCYHHIISNYTKFIHLTFNIMHSVCQRNFCSILKSFFNARFCIKTPASEFYSLPKPENFLPF